jgi:hypothetical protein
VALREKVTLVKLPQLENAFPPILVTVLEIETDLMYQQDEKALDSMVLDPLSGTAMISVAVAQSPVLQSEHSV